MRSRLLYLSSVDPSLPKGPSVNEREFLLALESSTALDVRALFARPVDGLPQDLAGVHSVFLPSAPLRSPLRFAWHQAVMFMLAWRHIRKWQPDLLVIRPSVMPLAMVLVTLITSQRYVLKTVGSGNLEPMTRAPGLLGAVGSRINRRLMQVLCRNAAVVDVCTPEFSTYLGRELDLPNRQFSWVPNATNVERFVPGDKAAQRRRHGLERYTRVLGFVGGSPSERGARQMVAALPSLLERDPGLGVVIVGWDPQLAQVRELACNLGVEDHVVFAGVVPYDEVPGYVQTFDVGVALDTATRLDEIGNSSQKVRQYIAVGVPVIAGVGAGTFIVREDLGSLVDPSSMDDFRAACDRWLRLNADERSDHERKARSYACANLSTQSALRQRMGLWRLGPGAPRWVPEGLLVLQVTTVPQTILRLFGGFVSALRVSGFEVEAVTSHGTWATAQDAASRLGIEVHEVPFTREVSLKSDLAALAGLLGVMRRRAPAIVHAHTPKAGLLAGIAGVVTGRRVRLYTVRGAPHLTAGVVMRKVLLASEKVACACAGKVIAVSHSLRDEMISQGVCSPEKIVVLAQGSGQGVDASNRFRPTVGGRMQAATLRDALGLQPEDVLYGFVGRLTRDKGIEELANAWSSIREILPQSHLVIAGADDEPRGQRPDYALSTLEQDRRVHLVGNVDNIESHYLAMDVLLFPSHREGFPNAVLEASAMEVPVVAFDAVGSRDAVVDGHTGFVVPIGDVAAFVEAAASLGKDVRLRAQLGMAGRERALEDFNPRDIYDELLDMYVRLSSRTDRRR